ncbi:hypothetical protein LUU34_00157700 [Aix galericulata]|nr:hypothetical protein LUU34_00157700 [Aix galericulata]
MKNRFVKEKPERQQKWLVVPSRRLLLLRVSPACVPARHGFCWGSWVPNPVPTAPRVPPRGSAEPRRLPSEAAGGGCALRALPRPWRCERAGGRCACCRDASGRPRPASARGGRPRRRRVRGVQGGEAVPHGAGGEGSRRSWRAFPALMSWGCARGLVV